MQIAQANSRAPSFDNLVSPVGLGCSPAQLGYGLVGRELRKRPRGGRRRLQPAVSVPERRLDHAVQPHAPVLVEHRPDLAVHAAFYAVVGCGDGAVGAQGLVEVGEQDSPSSHSGAVGHRDQNSEVRLMKVLAGIPIWAWIRFDRSQSRKRASARLVAVTLRGGRAARRAAP